MHIELVVISHRHPDGMETLIAYISRTLMSPERNYVQVKKEALALISASRSSISISTVASYLGTDHKAVSP